MLRTSPGRTLGIRCGAEGKPGKSAARRDPPHCPLALQAWSEAAESGIPQKRSRDGLKVTGARPGLPHSPLETLRDMTSLMPGVLKLRPTDLTLFIPVLFFHFKVRHVQWAEEFVQCLATVQLSKGLRDGELAPV